jgi:hypothetical protein
MPHTSSIRSEGVSGHERPLCHINQQATPTHRRIHQVHNEVASDSQHSVRHLHPIQPVHIPRTHLRGTSAHTVKPTRDHTTPLRSVGTVRTIPLSGIDRTTRTGGQDPTTTSNGSQRPDTVCEASLFGKEFLRMAGIVQMLHARKQSNDN